MNKTEEPRWLTPRNYIWGAKCLRCKCFTRWHALKDDPEEKPRCYFCHNATALGEPKLVGEIEQLPVGDDADQDR